MGDGDETGSTSLSANTASDTTSDTSSTLSDDSGGEKARLAIERIRSRGGADDLDSESLSLQLEEASFQNSFQHSAAGDATPAAVVSSVADASLSVEGPVTVSPGDRRAADAGGLAETTSQMHAEASVERGEQMLEVAAPTATGVEMEASQDSTAAVLRLDDEALDNADDSDMIAGVSPVRSTASIDPHEVPTHTHTHTAALSSSASSLVPAPASELMSASLTAEELQDSLGPPAAAPTSTPTPAPAPHGGEPDATPLATASAPAAAAAAAAEAAHPPVHPPSPDTYTAVPAVPSSAAAPPATAATTAAATPPAAHRPFVRRSPPSPVSAQAQGAPVQDAAAAGAAAAGTPVAQGLNDTLLMSPHQPQHLLPPLLDSVVRGASGRLAGDRLLRPAAAAAAAISDDGEDHEDGLDVMGDKEASTLNCLGVSARAPQARGLDARTLHGIAVLDVSSNDLEELPAMPPTLRRLDASRNRLRSITGLAKCEALEVLNLRRNRLTAIANLDRCFRLRHLFLGRNSIRRVQNIEHAIHLETLDLSSNLLSVTASLRPLSMNQALRTLVLRGNPLADPAGRKRICFAGLPPCATRLVLGGLCRMYGVVERIDMGEKASYVCFASGPDIASLAVRRLGGRAVEDADGTPYTVSAQVKPDSAGRKRRVWFANIPDEDPVAVVSDLLRRACVLGAVDALEEQPARRWAFRDRGSSKWLPFDGKCSAHLTDAARRSADCMLESGGVCWDFNFETLTQRHPVSGRIRDLRPPAPTREVFVTFSSATASAERAKKLLHEKYLTSVAKDALEWPIDDAFYSALCRLSSLEPAVLNVRQMFDCFPLVMNLCPKLRCLDDKLLTQRGVVNTTAVASRVQTTLIQNRTGVSAAVMSDTALTDDTELVARDGVNALDVSHLASGMARLAEEDESIRREKGWAPADLSAVSECPVKAHDKGPGLMKHRSEGYSVPGRAFDAARRMEAHDQVVKQEKVKKRLLMERVEPLPPTEPVLSGNAAAAAAAAASLDLRRRLDVTQSTDASSSFSSAAPPPPPPQPSQPQPQEPQQPLHADATAQAAPQARTLAASKSLGGNGWRTLHKAPSTSPRSSRPGVAVAAGAPAPARVASPPQDRRRMRQQQPPAASASAAPKRHVPAEPVRRRQPPQPSSAAEVSVFSGTVSGVDDSMASTALQLESVMNKMCKRRPRARVAPFGVAQAAADAPVDGTSQLSAHPSAHSSFLTDVSNLSGISNVDVMLQQEHEQEQDLQQQQRRSNSRGKVRFAPGSSPPSQQSHMPPQMARAQRRQAAVPTPDLAAAAAAPVADSQPAPRPKERATLQEFVSEWLETFGNDFVTLHLALKTLLVLAEGGSSAEVVRYKDIVTSSGMLKEVEIPTEVVLGYGITEESQPPLQPVTERDKVLAMIAQMKQTKVCPTPRCSSNPCSRHCTGVSSLYLYLDGPQ